MEKLSNKTKAQLLEIIERKDAVERELRDVNKTLNNKIEHLNSEIDNFNTIYTNSEYINNNLKDDLAGTEKELNKTREELEKTKKELSDAIQNNIKDYDILKSDYENICDTLATERIENKNKLHKYNICYFIAIIITAIITYVLTII